MCSRSMSSCSIEFCIFFFKQKTAYEMRISDGSSDVCSSDLQRAEQAGPALLEAENEEFEEPAARSRLDRHRLEPRADPVEARMGAARLRHGRRPARSATRREEAAPAPGW